MEVQAQLVLEIVACHNCIWFGQCVQVYQGGDINIRSI